MRLQVRTKHGTELRIQMITQLQTTDSSDYSHDLAKISNGS